MGTRKTIILSLAAKRPCGVNRHAKTWLKWCCYITVDSATATSHNGFLLFQAFPSWKKNQYYSTTTEHITFFLLLSSFIIKQLWNKIIVWHNSWVKQKLFCNAVVAKSTCHVAALSKPTKRFSIYKQQKPLCFGNNNFVLSVFLNFSFLDSFLFYFVSSELFSLGWQRSNYAENLASVSLPCIRLSFSKDCSGLGQLFSWSDHHVNWLKILNWSCWSPVYICAFCNVHSAYYWQVLSSCTRVWSGTFHA